MSTRHDRNTTLRNVLVTKLFVDIADQDYVLARLAFQKRFYHSFYWNASQAAEKYLKSCLLLNGGTALGYGHNLQRLYADAHAIAGEFLPYRLEEPRLPNLGGRPWPSRTPEEVLEKLELYGGPDGRYNIFGYAADTTDLVYFDHLIWAIRRVSFNLDAYPFIGQSKSGVPQTVREMLRRSPGYTPRGSTSRLDKLMHQNEDVVVLEAATHLNFAFAPDQQEEGAIRQSFSGSVAPLHTEILSWVGTNLSGDEAKEVADLAQWAKSNMKLPRVVQDQIEQAENQLRSS